ncbi:SusC/RagA family TonB-linked outer membrane protein [Chitinophaga sancti]|uniref:SusC/RagA family TonB-linked outer membrane protein n=1 Tax=Chitinophaga sancti TaxID=1004 RepID=UPI002A75F5EC|nr:SusC/RagA family TonB-linked outer membrane protein [Chitinophaga sancti]WPQ61908.1 SusC/RagA family TonB-linked outer membrane protein [Chitinophaga sancti]
MNNAIHNHIAMLINRRCSKYHQKYKRAYKFILTMKIVMFLLALSLQSYAAVVNAQSVSLNFKHATLHEVLRSVREQTGYSFILNGDFKSKARPVTIMLKSESLQSALDKIFKEQPFTYIIDHQIITVVSRPVVEVPKNQPPLKVQGVVTDEANKPLPGVTIKVKETGAATITKSDGAYHINCEPDQTLIFSFLGFETKEVLVGHREVVDVTLTPSNFNLNETVIKGYYSTTRALNTGNVTTIKSDVLSKNPVNDLLTALEGRVPGLFISQVNGMPGGALTIKMRGQNSLRADANNPLYIIDGVPFANNTQSYSNTLSLGTSAGGASQLSPFASLNMDDIERIEILKDADATAIYGSRGANGVILISTKKGSAGQSKVDFNVYQGAGRVSNKLDLMNSQEYLKMRNEAMVNDGVTTPAATDYDLNGKWGDPNQYTDWQKVLIGGTSHITDAQGSVSGGNAQTQFMFGGGYRRETTVFPADYSDVKASGHMSISHSSVDGRFKSNLNVSYVNDNNRLPFLDFTNYILYAPNTPAIYDDNGNLNYQNSTFNNPLRSIYQSANNLTKNLNTSGDFNYKIIEGMTIGVRGGYNIINLSFDKLSPWKGSNPATTVNPALRTHLFGYNELKTWILEPNLSYSKTLNNNRFDLSIGGTFQQNDQKGIGQIASGYSTDALISSISSATTLTLFSDIQSQYKYNALYARLSYNYADKYLINLTGRRDGSSRFGPGNQFSNFGAVGVGYLFTNENWIKDNLPALSFGKIRGSVGITGNDQIPDYGYLSTYNGNGTSYQGISILNPTQLTNPSYRWEKVKKLEVGLEAGFLDNRILLNVSWYRNRTENQLVGYALPSTTGFTTVQANLPALIQNTGTEIEITSTNIKNKDFNWTTSANITIPRNKLIAFDNLAGSSYASRYVVGQPLDIQLLYQYTGLDPVKKIYTFEDLNKNGTLDYGADFKPFFKGQRFYGGVNNNITFHDFQLDFLVQFVKQTAYKLTSAAAPGIYFRNGSNQLVSTVPSDSPESIQKYTASFSTPTQTANANYLVSNGALTDASYIRLKNVSISYKLPKSLLTKYGVKQLRIYLQGQNLLTFTKYKGLDPETTAYGTSGSALLTLPTLRVMTAGIQLTL